MSWNNNGGNGSGKNPWGAGGNKGRGPSSGGPKGSGPEIPDIDALLRKTRQNFGGGMRPEKGLIGLVILVLAGLWLSSGVYLVQPGENAVIQRFGAYLRTQEQPGIGFHLPYPVETSQKVNVTLDRRIHIGFEETGIGRTGVVQKRDIPAESLMLTADANIVDIDVVVLWNISEAYKYLFNIREQEDTLKKSAESALREVVGQTKLQPIITEGRDDVATRIKTVLQASMDSYGSGIAIRQVLIQGATVHPSVIDAFDDVVAAIQDAEKFQNEATIYKNDILPKARGEAIKMIQEAQGYKQTQIAKSTGEASRFQEVYEAYLTGKDVTRERIYIETMEAVLKNAQKTIIDQQSGGSGVIPYLPLGAQNAPQNALQNSMGSKR